MSAKRQRIVFSVITELLGQLYAGLDDLTNTEVDELAAIAVNKHHRDENVDAGSRSPVELRKNVDAMNADLNLALQYVECIRLLNYKGMA